MLPENAQKFDGIVKCDESITGAQWMSFINGDASVIIPAGETIVVDIE